MHPQVRIVDALPAIKDENTAANLFLIKRNDLSEMLYGLYKEALIGLIL